MSGLQYYSGSRSFSYLKNSEGKAKDLALKLEFRKAYDTVPLDFLRAVLIKLGFCGKCL